MKMTSPMSDIQIQQNRKRKHIDDMDFYDDDGASSQKSSCSAYVEDDRRAHHNELERRRRDHIKDHFMCLKDAIPLLEGEKSSRALILKRAVEYIGMIQNKLNKSQQRVDLLKQKNNMLEAKLKKRDASPVAQTISPIPHHITYPSTSASLPVLHPMPSISTSINLPTTFTSTPSSSFINMSLIPEVGIRTTPQDILCLTQALLAQKVPQIAQTKLNFGGFEMQPQVLSSTFQSNFQRQMVSAMPF